MAHYLFNVVLQLPLHVFFTSLSVPSEDCCCMMVSTKHKLYHTKMVGYKEKAKWKKVEEETLPEITTIAFGVKMQGLSSS